MVLGLVCSAPGSADAVGATRLPAGCRAARNQAAARTALTPTEASARERHRIFLMYPQTAATANVKTGKGKSCGKTQPRSALTNRSPKIIGAGKLKLGLRRYER